MKRKIIYVLILVPLIYLFFFHPVFTLNTEETSPDGKYKATILLKYYQLRKPSIKTKVYMLNETKWERQFSGKTHAAHTRDPVRIGMDWDSNERGAVLISFYSASADSTTAREGSYIGSKHLPSVGNKLITPDRK